ncbi:hypothetical protein V6N12_005455 [Hibiscus sabdariffa]|uniref:AP2/ERF domain-containing protein n=1 Tax=Hibiscus sabdariffa TaxID=183260 RepID=A0ABR2A2R6_9ROSI
MFLHEKEAWLKCIHTRWGARIYQRVWLGTFNEEDEAAKVYDITAQRFRGCDAVTNFKKSVTRKWPSSIHIPSQKSLTCCESIPTMMNWSRVGEAMAPAPMGTGNPRRRDFVPFSFGLDCDTKRCG